MVRAGCLGGIGGRGRGWRWGWFVDSGMGYGKCQNLALVDLWDSTGLSAAWISPIGPLKVSFGTPLNRQDSDKSEMFQFQLGTTF